MILKTDLVGGRHLLPVGGPEPSEDVLGLQVLAGLAALEVTQATARPDVRDVVWKLHNVLCYNN